MRNAPIKHAVFAKPDGMGSVTACNDGDAGCVKFEIADINALEAEIYVDSEQRFIGNRCDTAPKDIKRDKYGRIVRNGSGCQGLNPGALVVVLATQMKKNQTALAIDAQNDFNTDQIWNQPAYRYTVHDFQPLKEAEAANRRCDGERHWRVDDLSVEQPRERVRANRPWNPLGEREGAEPDDGLGEAEHPRDANGGGAGARR